MRQHIQYRLLRSICLGVCLLLFIQGFAQPPVKKYTIREGKMVIELSKLLPVKELEDFIRNFDLADLDLQNFLKTNNTDSLQKLGWSIENNTATLLIISKPLFSFDLLGSPLERIILAEKHFSAKDLLPSAISPSTYGINKFKKQDFLLRDSTVHFFLRGHLQASQVQLAASFTQWQDGAIPMQRTDSGWLLAVKPGPGKHWYKFIVDGNWITDPENQQNENDGKGNINSVYYQPNRLFNLKGFSNAKKVYLTGSFNNWREKELLMKKTGNGWELPVMLEAGTHTYKFIVDGDWYADPANPDQLPDGHGAFNSVIRFGKQHNFLLRGYENAKQVVLAGTFNGWKEDELYLVKTDSGWVLPYAIGPGNYEYKFIVDRKWIADPANPLSGADGNSFLVIEPNYTFRLKAPEARKVYLAGDLNGWNPDALLMKKEGDYWIFRVHLEPGKHRYKFVVDGKWLLDPANKLWEQNEYGTGNSIVWIE